MRVTLTAILALGAAMLAPAGAARAQATVDQATVDQATVNQTIVNSETIDSVAVTLYRDPNRRDGAIDPRWPRGYALVTETRTITVPAGRSVIRFQGVSQGMWPETAIVTGLPRQVNEKNRDAMLISPAALVDAYLKRSVTVRRTNPATGKTIVENAVIESGPRGGVLLSTAAGVEALGCSGLPVSLGYAGVPDGLFAKPTLSVVTESPTTTTVTVQLSYLAEGFDWQANYVAQMADDGESLHLFAWLTVANGGSQGFANAHTQAVAGQLNKEQAARRPAAPPPQLTLRCWPMDITSTHPRKGRPVPPPPPPVPGSYADAAAAEIVVTAQRRQAFALAAPAPVTAMVAEQEQLGDLKLYRIPERVTVAAQSRKQVAMIDKGKVKVERVHVGDFQPSGRGQPQSRATRIALYAENREEQGLGLPLPSGAVALFERVGDEPLLVAEGKLEDRAIGDEVEIHGGESADVRYEVIQPASPAKKRTGYRVKLTNARSSPARFELTIPDYVAPGQVLDVRGAQQGKRNGRRVLRATIPANGEATFDFVIKTRAD